MDRLPRDYERQIAKKRLPGLLSAIAAAENRAATLPEEKGRAEAVRARSLRAVVAQLLERSPTLFFFHSYLIHAYGMGYS